MAPLQPGEKDAGTAKAQAVLDLTGQICRSLKERERLPCSTTADLAAIVSRPLPVPSGPTATTQLKSFDSQGCELWNAAANISQELDAPHEQQTSTTFTPRLIARLHVLAFMLIDAAHRALKRDPHQPTKFIRPFKTALRACRRCLQNGEQELALRVLERSSDYVAICEGNNWAEDLDTESRKSLLCHVQEFHLLRIMHAWKCERLDLAEYFHQKLSRPQLVTTTKLSEKAAELFHEIGKSLVKSGYDKPAITWLDRAMAIVDEWCNVQADPEIMEARLSVTSTLVDCLLRGTESSSFQRAQELIDDLCNACGLGNRLAVHLMQIKAYLARDSVPLQQLRHAIFMMVQSRFENEEAFKLIMKSIHLVRKVDAALAYDAIAELLHARLLDSVTHPVGISNADQQRIEQAVITYVFFATTGSDIITVDALERLQRVLDMVAFRNDNNFSTKATHAAQALMWKAAGNVQKELAEKWCDLLGHRLFENAGQANKDKIDRKTISVAMEANNFSVARTTFFRMPPASQNDNLTRYLAFKLALRCNDYRLAEESLQQIAKQSKDGQTYLYACVLAAQQSEMRTVAVAALQAILDHGGSTVHRPTLLRCTARLMIAEMKSATQEKGYMMNEIVRIFEDAARAIPTAKKLNNEQWQSEVQWWSKNVYNICLEHSATTQPDHTVRLLQVCITFIDAYSTTATNIQSKSLKNRKAVAHYLCAITHVAYARQLDHGSEDSLQHYLQARQHIAAFASIHDSTPSHEEALGEDDRNLNDRAFELLKYDLESILHLKVWDQLDTALQACLECQSVDRWDTLADLIVIIRQQCGTFQSHSGTNEKMDKIMDKIINETWQRDRDITKAARWLRLSFSMDLDDGSGAFALELLRQAASMAKSAVGKNGATYPDTELQWLAATAFNKAIDLLSAKALDNAESWFKAALEVARYASDNGALHSNLTHRHTQAMARLKQMQG